MYRSWLEQDRIHALFDQLIFQRKAPKTEHLYPSEAARREASIRLVQSFEKMILKCFPGIIGPIVPINPEHTLEQPDVSLFFKPSRVPKRYEWLDGMELQAKVLQLGQSEEYFRNSYEYRRQKGMIIVMPMSSHTPASIFKPIFFSEIDRIGNILQYKG